mgnify:CR=1 FL=1
MYFNTKNTSIYYEKYGTKDKVILILPGWGNTRTTFTNIINFFKEDYTIYIIDYPGFGNSPIPQDELTIYDYTNIIRDFLEENNIVNPIIIAHSFGGRITTLLAGYYKEKIDKKLEQKAILYSYGFVIFNGISNFINKIYVTEYQNPVYVVFNYAVITIIGILIYCLITKQWNYIDIRKINTKKFFILQSVNSSNSALLGFIKNGLYCNAFFKSFFINDYRGESCYKFCYPEAVPYTLGTDNLIKDTCKKKHYAYIP